MGKLSLLHTQHHGLGVSRTVLQKIRVWSIKDSIAVARNLRLRQQGILVTVVTLVCGGEWWAAAYLFVVVARVLDGDFFLFFFYVSVGRVLVAAISKGGPYFLLAPVRNRISLHSLVIVQWLRRSVGCNCWRYPSVTMVDAIRRLQWL